MRYDIMYETMTEAYDAMSIAQDTFESKRRMLIQMLDTINETMCDDLFTTDDINMLNRLEATINKMLSAVIAR